MSPSHRQAWGLLGLPFCETGSLPRKRPGPLSLLPPLRFDQQLPLGLSGQIDVADTGNSMVPDWLTGRRAFERENAGGVSGPEGVREEAQVPGTPTQACPPDLASCPPAELGGVARRVASSGSCEVVGWTPWGARAS